MANLSRNLFLSAAVLVCVGDWTKVCVNPDMVVAIYQIDNEYGKVTQTVIALNDGQRIKTTLPIDRIVDALAKAGK